MIGVLTHHWAKPDAFEQARALLDGNGEAQSRHPGFFGRLTPVSCKDSGQITTLVVWASHEAYNSWRASPERAKAMAGADALWSRPPESERYDMADG